MYWSYVPCEERRSERSSNGMAISRYALLVTANTSLVSVITGTAKTMRTQPE